MARAANKNSPKPGRIDDTGAAKSATFKRLRGLVKVVDGTYRRFPSPYGKFSLTAMRGRLELIAEVFKIRKSEIDRVITAPKDWQAFELLKFCDKYSQDMTWIASGDVRNMIALKGFPKARGAEAA